MRVNLKEARKAKKLTQRYVAEHLDFTERGYQHIEAGTRGTSEENWLKLFHLFDEKIPLNKLMEK